MNTELNYEAVEKASLLLINAHPEDVTTILEVKTLLRYLGYHATQGQVSNFMSNLDDDGLLSRHIPLGFMGFKIYKKSEITPELKFEFTLHQSTDETAATSRM